ncbi:hypothetical protein X975_14954, partial [Stegodyphus mimosarum]
NVLYIKNIPRDSHGVNLELYDLRSVVEYICVLGIYLIVLSTFGLLRIPLQIPRIVRG